LALQTLQSCGFTTDKAEIGKEAPGFAYQDLDGNARRLADSKGKVVMLRFWADWCPPCSREFPLIEQAYQEMRDKGLEVIAVNVKQPEARVQDYIRNFQLSFTIALDRDGKITEQYNVKGIPMNFIINRDGILKQVIVGTISDVAMLRHYLAPHL
jgi:peroxiredoxin